MEKNHILCMIDFSEETPALLRYATHLSEAYQAKLWVLHVYFVPSGYQGEIFIPKEALESYEKQCMKDFSRLKQGDDLKDHEIHFEARHGDIVEEANQLIEQKKIKLLVVGNRSDSLLVSILGSNTLKLIYHARCPVLSVPPSVTFQPFRRILLATDWEESPRQRVVHIMQLLSRHEPTMDIIHVAQKQNHAIKEMNTNEFKIKGVPHTLYCLWENHVEEGLEHHIAEHENDLIILFPRHHDFFDRLFQQSITRQMVFHAKVPLLTIRA